MGFRDTYRAERAKLLAAPDSATSVYYRQPVEPVRLPPEPVLLPAFCNLHRQPALIVAERHDNQLKMIRSERVPSSFDGGSVPTPAGLGAFALNSAGWTGCAHCGAKSDPAYNVDSLWWCSCERCGDNVLFQCAGHRNGEFRCANGTLMNMHSINNHPTVAVQGWRSIGAAPHQAAPVRREPLLFLAPPPVPRISAPPSSTLRIGFRGRQ